MNCNDEEICNEHDLLLESITEDADNSFLSDFDDSPNSVNIDFSNGSPLSKDDFNVAHYNINSILSEDKLDQLQEAIKILNVSVLICTESKLDEKIPTNLI